MTTSFIIVIIGVILGNIGHTAVKDPTSAASPTKFSLLFWIKDNWLKVLHSLTVACGLNLALQLSLHDIELALGFKWYNIYGLVLGICPDAFLSYMKNKFGWLQPKNVTIKDKTYTRKDG